MTRPAVLVSILFGRAFAGTDSDFANRMGACPNASHVVNGLLQRGTGEVLIDDAVRDEWPSVGPVSICSPNIGCDMRTSIERVSCLYGSFMPSILVVLLPNLPRMFLKS